MIDRVAALIHQTFAVSREEAQAEAAGVLDLARAKGGDAENWSVIENYVMRHLGERLPWRDEAQKLREQERRQSSVSSYKAYLDATRPAWSKKWN